MRVLSIRGLPRSTAGVLTMCRHSSDGSGGFGRASPSGTIVLSAHGLIGVQIGWKMRLIMEIDKRHYSPMPKLIGRYFDAWIGNGNAKLFGNLADDQRFYQFVKACHKYANTRRDGSWLRHHLEAKGMIPVAWIRKACQRFDIILAFLETPFPDVWVECRNRDRVWGDVTSWLKAGTDQSVFTFDEADQIADAYLEEHKLDR